MKTLPLWLCLVFLPPALLKADIPVTCLLESSIFTPEFNVRAAAETDHSKYLVNREKTGLGNKFLESLFCWNDQTGDFVAASFGLIRANSTPQVATIVDKAAQLEKGTVLREPAGDSADRWWVFKGKKAVLMVAAARNPISKAYLNIQYGYYNPAGWEPNATVNERIPTDSETNTALAHLGVGDPLPAEIKPAAIPKRRSSAIVVSASSRWIEVAAGTALSEAWQEQLAREVLQTIIDTTKSKCVAAGWEESYIYFKPPQMVCEWKSFTQPQYSLFAFASNGKASASAGVSSLGTGYAGTANGQPAGASAGINIIGYRYYQSFGCSTYYYCGDK